MDQNLEYRMKNAPWMVSALEYAQACDKAIRERDYHALNKLGHWGRRNHQWLATEAMIPSHEAEKARSLMPDKTILTTADIAAELGITTQAVRQLARSHGVGQQISRGTWVFTPEDLERMRDRRPGTPGHKKNRVPPRDGV